MFGLPKQRIIDRIIWNDIVQIQSEKVYGGGGGMYLHML